MQDTNKALTLLNEMAIFARVVETESFSATARQLGLTPSAVSRSVSRLEKALGIQLLQRTTRKLCLNDSGREVYASCIEIVNAAQTFVTAVRQLSPEPQGLLQISVPKAVGRFVIHPHIPDFLARFPKIDLRLQLDDQPVDLVDGRIDLALRITDKPPTGLIGRKLTHIQHLVCATPAYLARHGVPQHPHDLAAHNCITLGEDARDARWKFYRDGKSASVTVNARYAVNHTGARLDAALQHLGIASLPWFTARHALQQGQILPVLADWRFQTRYCGALWLLHLPTRHLPARVKVFMDFIAERLQQTQQESQVKQLVQPYESPEANK